VLHTGKAFRIGSIAQNARERHFAPSFSGSSLTVTVAICTRHRPALLSRCLAAVNRLDPGPDQVIVIDNSEGDEDTESVAKSHSALYICEPVAGLSRARNRALVECRSEIIAFLDDDAIATPEWLANLIPPFEDEAIAVSTGRIVDINSDPMHPSTQGPRRLTNGESHWFEKAAFGFLGTGSNMAFRRSACREWNVFDERLGRGAPFHVGEETYAYATMLLRGFTAVYRPDAIVLHPPLRRDPIEVEARNAFAYSLLLLFAFPTERLNLARFILRRICGRPLGWQRDPQEPGDIVSSSRLLLLSAVFKGIWLFLRTPKTR
jgi:glycosyltransferase involved in cell wall biosynthesis